VAPLAAGPLQLLHVLKGCHQPAGSTEWMSGRMCVYWLRVPCTSNTIICGRVIRGSAAAHLRLWGPDLCLLPWFTDLATCAGRAVACTENKLLLGLLLLLLLQHDGKSHCEGCSAEHGITRQYGLEATCRRAMPVTKTPSRHDQSERDNVTWPGGVK
jgi:hypothetical protein